MELKEVDLKKVDDLMFKRIGLDVPMLPDTQGFPRNKHPVRALAVSNRFGYTLYAHSQGFSAAKTADLIEIAEKLKDKSNDRQTALEISVATVPGDNVRSLSLSNDELTVAVCVGDSVNFYDLPALVQKSDICPFEVRKVDPVEDTPAKEFSWSRTDTDAYLIVTNDQKLLLGRLGSAPEVKVEKGVLTASWSDDGQHVTYGLENGQLIITTSSFSKSFNLELPAHLSDEDVDSDLIVDAIRWVRPDSILVGYVRVNSEGEEDGYPLFLVTSTSGNLAEEQSTILGLVFYHLFPSVDSFVTPSGSGPYMLLDYLKPWEMVVAASRKSIDDHIVLVGWIPENGKGEAYSLELANDLWLPRVELQENGDDNAIVGLAIDRTTTQIQITDPKDDSGDSKLPPCPVLIYVTLEGKLSFFSFARLDGKRQLPDFVSAPSDIPESKRLAIQSSQVSGKISSPTPVPTSKELEDLERRTSVKQADRLQEEKGEMSILGKTLSATPVSASKAMDESERRTSGKQADMQEKKDEISRQSAGFISNSKGDGKDSTLSVLEGFTRPSPSPESGTLQKTEERKLGMISDSKSVSLTMDANFPAAFAFDDSTRASSFTKTSSSQTTALIVSSSALGISSQATGMFLKGNDKASVTRPVSPQPQRASQFPAATPSVYLSSSSPGKGFQGGSSAFPTSPGQVAFTGKVRDSGAMTQPPGTSGPGMKISQVISHSSQRMNSIQRLDKVYPGLQSRAGQDQQLQARATGVSDMEAAFVSELEKIRRMAEEVDQLMSYLEGRGTTNNLENNATFTRHALEELEQGIHLLSEDCKEHRKQLTREKQNVEDLRDESLRVDSWRIYARSLMEQKIDSRHQELWTLQKLHPELDMKRKRVLKADQDLKLKIAEMEKHLHSLELKEWQADNARRRTYKQVRNPGQFMSVQNLYDTVNAQMAVAEELSLSLAQQMEALNIDWLSPAKGSKKTTAASILKSVGAQREGVNYSYIELNGQRPISRQRLSYSPVSKGTSSVDRGSTPVDQVPDLFVNSQETTRRRRDSMDATWVESGAPKTTIKRPVHIKPDQGFASGNLSLPTFRQAKGNTSEVTARESLSQSRHVRQTQTTRIATQPTNLSFWSQGFEAAVSASTSGRTATSVPQWPDQQRRSSSPPSNGDFGVAHSTLFVSAESEDGLFKFANNSTSGSKVTPIAPAHAFVPFGKQGTMSTSDGSSFGLAIKTSSTTAGKQYSAGSVDGPAGGVGGNLASVPATRPRLLGAFDGGAGDTIGKTVGFSKGTVLGSTFGTISSTGNQVDGSRLLREASQNQGRSPSVGSGPLVPGSAPSILTGLKPALLTGSSLVLSGSTSGRGASVSTPESLQSAVRNFDLKQNADGRPDRGSESEPSLKKSFVTNILVEPSGSAPGIQKTEVVPYVQGKELAKQSDELKAATNSQNASPATFGSSGKSFFDSSSQTAFAGPGSSRSPATVSPSGFTFATPSGPSSQPEVPKSVFITGTNTPVEASSSVIMSSASSSLSTVRGSASPVSTTGAATVSQSISLPSSTVIVKSDLKTLTPTSAPLFSSPVVTPAPRFGIQDTSKFFPVSVASTGLTSGNTGASAGGQASSNLNISSDAGKSFLTSASSASATVQSTASHFATSGVPTAAQSGPSPFTVPSASAPSETMASPFAPSGHSGFSTGACSQMTSSPFGQSSAWPSSSQQPFMFPNSSSMASTASVTLAGLDNNEDDMEEEASTGANATSLGGFGGFGGLGLGSSNTPAQTQKTSPFGGSLFGSSPAPTLSAPSGGQLFRPAAFSLPAAQPSSPQQSGGSPFGSGFGSSGFSQNNLFSSSDAGKPFGSPSQASPGGFGQPAQLGPGQQALGSALGAFGQTRQVGFGTPSFGVSGGFGPAPQGGGFANAGSGGGFAGAATGGGFAGAGVGGGFANAATGGGFAGAAAGGGFAAAATGAGFGSSSGGGLQGFGGTPAGQPFGGGMQASLFTQMRK